MQILEALILGAIQGLTEILPISSSAHLVLAPKFFHWTDLGLGFDAVIHLGTFSAIFYYFRKEIIKLVLAFFKSIKKRKVSDYEEKLALYIVLGSIPAVIAAVFLQNLAETVFRSTSVVLCALLLGSALLFIADRFTIKQKTLEKITLKDSLIIGAAQILALMPGISRSGATISFGRFLKFDRESAAKFSFLLSLPVTLGAGLFELKGVDFTSNAILVYAAGILSSAIFGFIAVKFMLKYISNHNFNIFVYYRLFLALLIIIFLV
ncbi:undecaprenyl-diphosphatase UppP [bacterium CG2_30_37_16]|nr:MAG: undecaprenyl-diphosphatase UppP [bacterium CG2_30_37_16]